MVRKSDGDCGKMKPTGQGRFFFPARTAPRLPLAGSDRRGFALWIVVVVAFFIAMFMLIITLLNHGEIQHLDRTEKLVRCEMAIRSIFQKHATMLSILPWTKRPCRERAWSAPREEFDGVGLSVLLEDSPGRERSVDLWIGAEYGDVKRAAVYRVEVKYSILQKMNDLQTVYFSFLDDDQSTSPAQRPAIRERVDQVVLARVEKKKIRQETVVQLQKDQAPASILEVVGLAQEDDAIIRSLASLKSEEQPVPPPANSVDVNPPLELTRPVATLDLERKHPRPAVADIDPDFVNNLENQQPKEPVTVVEVISPPVKEDPFDDRELLERILKEYLKHARGEVKDLLKEQRRLRRQRENRGIRFPIDIIEDYIPPVLGPRPGNGRPDSPPGRSDPPPARPDPPRPVDPPVTPPTRPPDTDPIRYLDDLLPFLPLPGRF